MQRLLLPLEFVHQPCDAFQGFPIRKPGLESAIPFEIGIDGLAFLAHVTTPHWRGGKRNCLPMTPCRYDSEDPALFMERARLSRYSRRTADIAAARVLPRASLPRGSAEKSRRRLPRGQEM